MKPKPPKKKDPKPKEVSGKVKQNTKPYTLEFELSCSKSDDSYLGGISHIGVVKYKPDGSIDWANIVWHKLK